MGRSKHTGSLDTNTLLRLILGDVPEQTDAIERLLAKGGIFKVTDAVLTEMIYVLEKVLHKDRVLIQENVFAITRHKQFLTNKKLFERCMPLYRAHPKLSITDCLLVAHAELDNAPLYTFDKDIAKCTDVAHLLV